MILVTGARGVVGKPLCKRLTDDNANFIALSRQSVDSFDQLQWNLTQVPSTEVLERLAQVSSVVHCAPIWLLPPHLPLFGKLGIQRLVVFSSTSVLSKQSSGNQHEQALVNQLRSAEEALLEHCEQSNVQLTILRPSLIYGYGLDQNVSHIASFIRRFGFMLLVGKATGLRQPVHADDLVQVALNCLQIDEPNQLIYTVSGKDQISYRDMVKCIFNGLGRKPIIISIPLWLFRPALVVAAKLGSFSYTPEMADRMNQDLNYDYSDAANDLSFSPQGFLEQPERDLLL